MRTNISLRTATLAIILGAVLGNASAVAGPLGVGRDPATFLDNRIERMTESLELTSEQQGEIRAILEEQQAQAEQQRAQTRERIGAVLTPEQLARIDERRQAGIERGLDRLADRLDLTDEQLGQVRGLMLQTQGTDPRMDRAEIREQIKAVLSEEQRARFETMERSSKRGGHGKPCGAGPAF
jgi:Spy/CpxP family protein refolding chaperone